MDGARRNTECEKVVPGRRDTGRIHGPLRHKAISRLPLIIFAAVIIAFGGFTITAPVISTRADDGDSLPIQYCLSCHVQELEIHNKLGSQNGACWSCHDQFDMSLLHLANGETPPLSESSKLCGQCHLNRYDAWQQGTHGIPGDIATVPCSSCHDPHNPAVVLADITKPPTTPVPPPPSPPSSDVLIIIGISFVVLVLLGLGIGRRRKLT